MTAQQEQNLLFRLQAELSLVEKIRAQERDRAAKILNEILDVSVTDEKTSHLFKVAIEKIQKSEESE